MTPNITIMPDQITVRSPWNPNVRTSFLSRGGKWIPRGGGYWVLPNTPTVMDALGYFFGLSQEHVRVRVALHHPLLSQAEGILSLRGYTLASHQGLGQPVRLAKGVGVWQGAMLPGAGTTARPKIMGERNTILELRVASDFARENQLWTVGEEVVA